MKKKCISVLLLVGACLLFTGCSKDVYYTTQTNSDYQEWISPDGVHYWFGNLGYGKVLAPKYDHDGNLVIDK